MADTNNNNEDNPQHIQPPPQNVTFHEPVDVETVNSEQESFFDTTNVSPISLFPK